jgi:hypothetical protein
MKFKLLSEDEVGYYNTIGEYPHLIGRFEWDENYSYFIVCGCGYKVPTQENWKVGDMVEENEIRDIFELKGEKVVTFHATIRRPL